MQSSGIRLAKHAGSWYPAQSTFLLNIKRLFLKNKWMNSLVTLKMNLKSIHKK
jgi:hypothetical protein